MAISEGVFGRASWRARRPVAADGQDTRAIPGLPGPCEHREPVRYTELAPGRFKDFWKD
jgi:hypothetical protein